MSIRLEMAENSLNSAQIVFEERLLPGNFLNLLRTATSPATTPSQIKERDIVRSLLFKNHGIEITEI